MIEIWKRIENFPDYEISNLGRVKSYKQKKEGRILPPIKTKKGYLQIQLYENKKYKRFYIHKLVALAFIPNPNQLEQINHKDENKENNKVDNLEWCDNWYNIHYGTKIERTTKANECCKTTSKEVYSIDEKGEKEYFLSIGEAERKTGISHCNIVAVLKGRREKAGNRKWFYKE